MNKEYVLSNLPPGYVHVVPGEDMPEVSYYVYFNKGKEKNDLKNINNWYKYNKMWPDEKRNEDTLSIFIKAAPVVPPAPKYQYKEIKDINIGDIFAYENTGEPVIITYSSVFHDKYTIIGINNTLNPFSFVPVNKEEMLKYLNNRKYIYITSIAPQIEKTLKLARKLVLDSKNF